MSNLACVVWLVLQTYYLVVKLLSYSTQHLAKGHHLFGVEVISAEWHVLYESDVDITSLCEFDKIYQLIVIYASNHDTV